MLMPSILLISGVLGSKTNCSQPFGHRQSLTRYRQTIILRDTRSLFPSRVGRSRIIPVGPAFLCAPSLASADACFTEWMCQRRPRPSQQVHLKGRRNASVERNGRLPRAIDMQGENVGPSIVPADIELTARRRRGSDIDLGREHPLLLPHRTCV